ncbi:MAG: hypothetical protein ACRC42_02505, partial [Mycoplasma sp.]
NLTIPRGTSLQQALIRGQSNIGKSIALRNFALKPYFKNWKNLSKKMESNDWRTDIFSKLFLSKDGNWKKTGLRHAFNKWRNNANKLANNELQKNLYMKLMSKLYENGSKTGLRRAYNKWKNYYLDYIKRLNDAGKASTLLRQHSTKPIREQFRKAIINGGKFGRVKAMLTNALRVNDKDNLYYCFNKWRKNAQKLKEWELKCRFWRFLANAQDKKGDEYWKNRLHEALLRWRINCTPNKTLQYLTNVRIGTENLMTTLRKPHNKKIFDGLKNKADSSNSRHLLFKLLSGIDPKFDKRLLRKAYNTWKSKLGDTDKQKQKMKDLFNRYLPTPKPHKVLIHDPEQELVDAMTAYDLLKHNKAKPIADFCSTLMNIKRQMDIMKRNLLLKKLYTSLGIYTKVKARTTLTKWNRKAKLMQVNEDAETIQDYIRPKLKNSNDKRKHLDDAAKHLERYIKKVVFNKIKNEKNDEAMNNVLRKAHKNKEQMNKKTLAKYFNRWRDMLPELRKDDAATKIQTNLRSKNAKKKVDGMKKLNNRMKYLVLKLFAKYLDKRKITFAKWQAVVEKEKCDEEAKVIQDFLGRHLKNWRKKQAEDKLRSMFRMYVIKQLKNAIKKSSNVSGDRGGKLFNTLENIYIRRPYNKLVNGMRWIGKIKTIKRVKPKIEKALRLYWLPYYLKRWYENTVVDRNNKIIFLQNYLKARLLLWRKKADLRKAALLQKYLLKLSKDRDLMLRIPFKYWQKVTQFSKLNDQAETIQKLWKGNTSRKNAERLLAQKKWKDLVKKGLKNKLADAITKANDDYAAPLRKVLKSTKGPLEKRYATNDIVDYANDTLRNKYWLLL